MKIGMAYLAVHIKAKNKVLAAFPYEGRMSEEAIWLDDESRAISIGLLQGETNSNNRGIRNGIYMLSASCLRTSDEQKKKRGLSTENS